MDVRIEKRLCWALAALFLIIILPILLGRPGIFFGEAAVLSYPQQVFLARCFQNGDFPWWDGAVGAGAVDWSLRFSQGSCYPLNWPFLLIADPAPPGSYFSLFQLPLALHLLLTFGFAFLLARRGFCLGGAASALLALSWTVSPAVALENGRLAAVFSLSWIPAVALSLLRFAREGGRGRLLLGALLSALAYLGGDLSAAVQILLFTAVFALALAASGFVGGDRPVALRALLGGVAAIAVGGCLAGLRWSGLREAFRLVEAVSLLRPLPPIPRLSPAALAGFLVPGIFGADTGQGLWGPALSLGRSWPAAALPGGVASALLIACGLLSLRRRRGAGAPDHTGPEIPLTQFNSRVGGSGLPAAASGAPDHGSGLPAASGVALFCFLAGALLALLAPGRVLGAAPPVLPAFSWSLLLGVSFQSLRVRPETVSPSRVGKLLAVFAGVVFLALLWPHRAALGVVFPGLRGLASRAVPGFLLALFSAALAAGAFFAAARLLPRPRRPAAVFLLALLEIMIGAYRGFYRSASPAFPPGDLFGERRSGPRDHPAYRAVAVFAAAFPDEGNRFRRGYDRSAFDNLSWVFAAASPLGFDLAPLSRRADTAFSGACAGGPGELVPRDWASNFWRNMSVRFLLTKKPLAPPARPIPSGEGNYYAGSIPEPLPRWYFQDRWVVGDEERERFALLNFDLRDAGYCPREVWHVRPYAHLYPHPSPLAEAEWKEHFADLQRENRILSFDESSPDRLVFDLHVTKLSMLVVTDLHHPGWKARGDDRGEAVHRVNYLQRGVWCHPGRYTLTLEFLPPSLGPGLALTALGAIGVILILALPGRGRSA